MDRNLNLSKKPEAAKHVAFLLLIVIPLLIPSCRQVQPPVPVEAVRYEYIKTYDLQKLNNILSLELEGFLASSTMHLADFRGQLSVPRFPVRLYRVLYPTMIPELNIPTTASGLIAVPETGNDSMPVLSYQHGTVAHQYECPSAPDSSIEIRLVIAQYASMGYLVIAPDYVGLGASREPHAYFVKGSTDRACMDMLLASKQFFREMKIRPGKLFLEGWSQGGYQSMSFLRELESVKIPVQACASAAGCSDLLATFERWISNPKPNDAIFLPAIVSNLVFAMEHYYRISGLASSAILSKYYPSSADLYQWKMDWLTYLTTTSTKVREILKPDFIATGNTANTRFWQILDQNEAYRWKCITPLVMYYGEMDNVVPPSLVTMPAAYQNQLGSRQTRTESAGPRADHNAAFIYTLIHAKAWFDGMIR